MAAVRQVRRDLELLARLQPRGGYSSPPGPLALPEWLAIRTDLMEALAPFPEARYAAAERLLALVPRNESGV